MQELTIRPNIVNIGGLEGYEEGGIAHLNLEQAVRGLGFTQTQSKNGVEYTSIRWERVEQHLAGFGFPHKWGKDDFIPENIFYRLAMKAKNPAAEKFQAWVADEVIPSIRKTGGYIHGAQDMTDMEIVSKAFLIAQKTIEARDARINALESDNRALTESNAALSAEIAAFEPVKTYYEQILSSTGTLTTTQIAADYDLSAQKLNKILHEEGVQHKVNGQWILYTAYAGNGYTKSITIPIVRANGTPDAKLHTQWTQKGRLMIHDILTGRGIMANVDRMSAAS